MTLLLRRVIRASSSHLLLFSMATIQRLAREQLFLDLNTGHVIRPTTKDVLHLVHCWMAMFLISYYLLDTNSRTLYFGNYIPYLANARFSSILNVTAVLAVCGGGLIDSFFYSSIHRQPRNVAFFSTTIANIFKQNRALEEDRYRTIHFRALVIDKLLQHLARVLNPLMMVILIFPGLIGHGYDLRFLPLILFWSAQIVVIAYFAIFGFATSTTLLYLVCETLTARFQAIAARLKAFNARTQETSKRASAQVVRALIHDFQAVCSDLNDLNKLSRVIVFLILAPCTPVICVCAYMLTLNVADVFGITMLPFILGFAMVTLSMSFILLSGSRVRRQVGSIN